MEKHKPIIILSALLFFTVIMLATFIPLTRHEPVILDESMEPLTTTDPLSLGITPGPTPVKLELPDLLDWSATSSSPIDTYRLAGLTHHAKATLTSSEDVIRALNNGKSLTKHFLSYPKTTVSANAGNLTFIPYASDSATSHFQSVILSEDDVLQVVSWGYTTSFDMAQNPQVVQCPCTIDYYVFFSEPQTPQTLLQSISR